MRVGVLGTTSMGSRLASAFAGAGHEALLAPVTPNDSHRPFPPDGRVLRARPEDAAGCGVVVLAAR